MVDTKLIENKFLSEKGNKIVAISKEIVRLNDKILWLNVNNQDSRKLAKELNDLIENIKQTQEG